MHRLLPAVFLLATVAPAASAQSRKSHKKAASGDIPVTAAASVDHATQQYHSCGLSGDAKSSTVQALDRLKNRFDAPKQSDIDPRVTLATMLAPAGAAGDEHRFNSARAAEIEGYVVDVKMGGKETVNCHAIDPLYRDTHIEVALTRSAPATQRVIVEVTPRWRAIMQDAGADWITDDLRAALKGKKVRFRGWLMFDAEHRNEAVNTDPGDTRGAKNWRATDWELHPVTYMKILP